MVTLSVRDAQLEQFCRLIRARTLEHRQAVKLLLEKGLYSLAFGTLRQELDSLIRVSYLNDISKKNSPVRARKLVRDLVEGTRWRRPTHKGKLVPVTDREMLNAYSRAIGWEKLVYDFGCQLIHLSNLHDHRETDPVSLMDKQEKLDIIRYLKDFHSFAGTHLTFEILLEYLPMITDKVCDNTECLITEFESRMRGQLSSAVTP